MVSKNMLVVYVSVRKSKNVYESENSHILLVRSIKYKQITCTIMHFTLTYMGASFWKNLMFLNNLRYDMKL